MAEGIFVFDRQKRTIPEFNPAFLVLMGASPDSATSLRADDSMFVPADGDVEGALDRLVANGRAIELECQLRRADGSLVEVACSLSSTVYAGSEAVCAVLRDIT